MDDGHRWHRERQELLDAEELKEYACPANWCTPFYNPTGIARTHLEENQPFERLGEYMRCPVP